MVDLGDAVLGLTVIAGSRDDVDRFEFDRYLHADTAARVQARKANDEDGARPFTSVASCAADTLDGPAQATRCDSVFPAPSDYWERKSAR
jgi:hypothetical protein